MIILGIVCFGMHESSAALLVDGRLVAFAEEERFVRRKFYSGFPYNAIDYCLKSQNFKIRDVNYIGYFMDITKSVQWEYLKYVLRYLPHSVSLIFSKNNMINQMRNIKSFIKKNLDYKGKIFCIEHHLTHAANAFLASPFEKAAILTIDGVGEIDTIVWSIGRNNTIERLYSTKFPHSLGHVYLALTQYLGFLPNSDEYKIMGLSAYGKPVYIDFFREIIKQKGRGIEIDLSYFRFQFGREIRFSNRLEKKLGPARKKEGLILDKHKNIAASLQMRLEEVILDLVSQLIEVTGEQRLCLAGGVALNSVVNGKIANLEIVKDIYIPPTASDAGCSIGAAFYIYNCLFANPRNYLLNRVDWGPEYSEPEIEKILAEFDLSYFKPQDLFRRVANAISEGKIIGWFQNRMEAGQRALGYRSILADPRRKEMKEILNSKVKFREDFRPFAAAILIERFKDYFAAKVDSSPFMTMVFLVKNRNIPAVTHVDGSVRVQTVSFTDNFKLWELINEFYKITGIPVLLNTSFNLKDEPIVNTPKEAVHCFLSSGIDLLVLNDLLVSK